MTIGGVAAAATVVPGSGNTRLLVRTPSIEALQAFRNAAVDDFAFGYYGVEIATLAGAHGTFGGSVAVGASAPTVPRADAPEQAQQACAASGYCPDVAPIAAGLFYSDECAGWLDPTVDARWAEAAFAARFAYGRPPRCVDCPEGCRCPGGRRCRVEPGYYAAAEDIGSVAAAPERCAPPALRRCLGYSASVGGTECGAGYAQDSRGCGRCARGHFRSMGACEVCPAVDVYGAVLWPASANVAGALAAFLSIFGLKLVVMLVSARCDPKNARKASAVAYDALRQTAFFVVSVVVALQMIASVVVGATGDAPAELRALALGLGAFLFEPPMVNPDCVEGVSYARVTQIAILAGALAAALLDKALQLLPWLRPETLCCGWKCCAERAACRALRRVAWSLATPFLRYFLSTGLTVAYVRVVRVAIAAVDCAPSAALDGAYALDANELTPCFDAEHAPVYALAVVALAVVGVAWPAATVAYLTQRFTLPARKGACVRRCCVEPLCVERCCAPLPRRSDGSGGGAAAAGEPSPLPEGWSEHAAAERGGAPYYAHAESGTTVWVRPDAAAARALVAARPAKGGAARAPLPALPPGWEAHDAPGDGRRYYHHPRRGETVWELPGGAARGERDVAFAAEVAGAAAHASEVAAEAGAAEALPSVGSSALPAGWEAHHSEAHGATYFHHAATATTVWQRPTSDDAVGGGAPPLPVGWTALHDSASGRAYYHHAASQRTLWEHPARSAGAAGASEAEGGDALVAKRAYSALELELTALPRPGTAALRDGAEGAGAGAELRAPPRAALAHLNEMGCIPLCWRAKLRVARRPVTVQHRVDRLGGRARAYDVYVDNAFEPRFFWIPPLRNCTLLLLAVFDLGFSGRTTPTIAGALARCLLSSLVVLLFTVAVLAPCPYHRIDRWNIAKRIALLVLQNIGSGTTLALTLVELDGECSLYTVTYSANRAHNLTRSP